MGDDFSEPVKRALASRVGNLCSNPECRALASGVKGALGERKPFSSGNLGAYVAINACMRSRAAGNL